MNHVAPRHDPTAPDAVVMPRPTSSHQVYVCFTSEWIVCFHVLCDISDFMSTFVGCSIYMMESFV